MNFEKCFIQLIKELRKKEFYATRHVDVIFRGKTYKLLISAMEFGQRVELTGNSGEYLVFVYGIEGMDENGVLHKKDEQVLLKIVRRFTDDIRKELIKSDEEIKKSSIVGPALPHRVFIPDVLERTKTAQEKAVLVNRLLDRHNDYLFLYEFFQQKDEKYKRKAAKMMRLMNRMIGMNKKGFVQNG